ncbi:GNAT family N-acetyltransferase [Sphingomonas abietis]|uniref:GNAT family N-acetyltransferase n=1 Tax=Sphingomonas abietis TaxID=3012344 RepID=A0ABY7NL35_9SPHN|nr:GNAT family N-acetyltransferase [Sphingomonas abietis]WBO22255.1 GNAT family N-acetyltransferase [Sphingomonas abietis]
MIEYRDARPEDAPALTRMAADSFVETFGHLYRPQDLDSFLRDAFGPAGLPAQIGDPAYRIRVATDDGIIAGFAKMGPCGLPSPPVPDDAAELKQLYVLKPWQGAGIAQALMAWAIECARAGGAAHLVLSVYADNHRAQRFYARYGLAEIGAHPFMVGAQMDDDRIWSVAL